MQALRGDYTLLSVALPPGAHEVRFTFSSRDLRSGKAGDGRVRLLIAVAHCARHSSGGGDSRMIERALVVVPTYNERVNLPLIVPQILQQDLRIEVLVVDDNSPDGTGRLADEMAAAEPRIHVLHRPGKEGLGKAYLAGFRWALERGLRLHLRDGRRFQPRPQVSARNFSRRSSGPTWWLAPVIVQVSTSSTGRSRGCCSRSGANEYARRITGLAADGLDRRLQVLSQESS